MWERGSNGDARRVVPLLGALAQRRREAPSVEATEARGAGESMDTFLVEATETQGETRSESLDHSPLLVDVRRVVGSLDHFPLLVESRGKSMSHLRCEE